MTAGEGDEGGDARKRIALTETHDGSTIARATVNLEF